jgi:hypothetical protein
MKVIAIDPGPEQSAYVWLVNGRAVVYGKVDNHDLLAHLALDTSGAPLVIEKVASFGMPVGAEVFETVYWSGRFAQAWRGPVERITRHEIKMHFCHSARANDSTIRQAILDRFGGKERAIGRKASPGPLYGVSGDVWSALAVALCYADRMQAHGLSRLSSTAL